MPFSWNDLLWGLAAPLVTAAGLRFVLVWIAHQLFPVDKSEPDSEEIPSATNDPVSPLETSLPLVAGAAVGYFKLKLGPWIPDAHYEWLPIGVVMAMLAASAVSLMGRSALVRFGILPVVSAAVAAGVGYLLMPTWDALSPPYVPYLLCWCVGVTVVSATTELSSESSRWPFTVVWLGTCLAVSAIVAISDSLLFTQIAGLPFGASLGLVVAGIFLGRSPLGGIGLTSTTYLAGILLIAHVNSWSDVPIVCYWLPMAGPFLAAVLGMFLPFKFPAALRATLVILAAAIPSTIAVAMGIVATLSE
ncbi:hypothetical protein Pan97_48900 [Bremerella volcania]|uniref:Uncharacterized protein n=1 Tax=Bremerella volcania TaxID=2527984 RepID=A0A518CF27_9BACT|nr:hypothetical protein [Bremerella volcania]QDU77811.1 hypothetical protein Pan97_48900 [Bremerella volcania]